MLDLGTGGGELLCTFEDLPADARATEGYRPNVAVARAALASRGIEVDEVGDDDRLPYPDRRFDLVLDRHQSFDASEVTRVLRPGGAFVTQQVGGQDLADLNELLGAPAHDYAHWDLDTAVRQVTDAGLRVRGAGEVLVPTTFLDVGAVVQLLPITPWQVPGFAMATYRPRLRDLHGRMSHGPLVVHSHRFYLVADSTTA